MKQKVGSLLKVEADGDDLWITIPSGKKTVISKEDAWIFDVFPVLVTTGGRSEYFYAERGVKTEYSTLRERVPLHRLIAKPMGLEQVDHRDRDRFNNRRSNLRIFHTRGQNMANTAPRFGRRYKGVFDRSKGRTLTKPYAAYVSYIDAKTRGMTKRKYLGYFLTQEEAARAYDAAAKEVWGEFAWLNFPEAP